jgi:hypothetical protein
VVWTGTSLPSLPTSIYDLKSMCMNIRKYSNSKFHQLQMPMKCALHAFQNLWHSCYMQVVLQSVAAFIRCHSRKRAIWMDTVAQREENRKIERKTERKKVRQKNKNKEPNYCPGQHLFTIVKRTKSLCTYLFQQQHLSQGLQNLPLICHSV